MVRNGSVWKHLRLGLVAVAVVLAGVGVGSGPPGAAGERRVSLVVGLQPGVTADTLDRQLAIAGAWRTSAVPQLGLAGVSVPEPRAADLLTRLRAHPAVRHANRDVSLAPTSDAVMEPLDEATREVLRESGAGADAVFYDPFYAQGRQWNLDIIGAPRAWDLLPAGASTVVAILDTGLDYGHPEFAGRINRRACDMWANACPYPAAAPQVDVQGHGTHVAGIIGANTGNAIGVASVTGGRVSLLPVRVLSQAGSLAGDQVLTLSRAVVYAVDNGAKVINMSLGGACGTTSADVPGFFDAIEYAHHRDVLLVVSAGNGGGCYGGRFWANSDRVISVAATDSIDNGATFTDRGRWVDVAAPGVRILSTIPMDQGGYALFSGTSMATPHVAGLAALLYQAPGATKAKVMEWITSTCDPTGINVFTICGGRVNAYRAVHLAMRGTDPAKP